MLGENCPVATPTPENSNMSFEQSDTPRDTPTPEKPESSVEIQPLVESHQDSLLIVGESSLGFLQSR